MKTIFKVKIHVLLYLLMFICIITGLFKDLLIFMFIIIIHEIGHITAGIILKQKIEKIILLPFGGITIFNMPLNVSIYKELIIASMGPVFQIIGYLIFNRFINNEYFFNYNLIIILFNLIPIFPLDGSKILSCILNIFYNFKQSFVITFYISFLLILCFIVLIIFSNASYFFILIFCFLGYKCVMEYSNYANIYNKFLFERYIKNYKFSKLKYINNIYQMYKGKKHLIKDNGIWKTEKEILRKRFDFKRNMC